MCDMKLDVDSPLAHAELHGAQRNVEGSLIRRYLKSENERFVDATRCQRTRTVQIMQSRIPFGPGLESSIPSTLSQGNFRSAGVWFSPAKIVDFQRLQTSVLPAKPSAI